jgi:actin-related protein 4
VVQVWTDPTPLVGQEEMVRGQMGKPFEFPDGYNQLFTVERFKVAESLFDHRAYVAPPSPSVEVEAFPAPGPEKTILPLIKQSLSQVDVDIRPALLANVVVTGGSSLIPSLVQRLNIDLDRIYPSTRV